jgi:ribose/xylose/arabinose/galactoside ABC-type transport system permease subunit
MSFNPTLPAQPGQPGPFQVDRPPRRRPAYAVVALGWEAVLLLVLVVVLVIAGSQTKNLLSGSSLWLSLAAVGLLASGFALSLRAGTPNLAVAGASAMAGVVYAKLLQDGTQSVVALLAAVGAATLLGLVLGLVAGLTMAPAWAVSLVGLAVAQLVASELTNSQVIVIRDGRLDEAAGIAWFAAFVVISIAGGLLCLVPAVRRVLGGFRFAGDDATWRGGRLTSALLGFTGSSLLAGLGGVLFAMYVSSAQSDLSMITLVQIAAIVLLAGVSVFGGRGGVAGVVLATVIVSILGRLMAYWDFDAFPSYLGVGVVAILIGLLVSRLLESIAGPPDAAAVPPPAPAGPHEQGDPARFEPAAFEPAAEPLPQRTSHASDPVS